MNSVYIPTNYTDAGKILSVFPIRNAIEAVIIGFPLIVLTLGFLPFGLTGNLIACLFITVPAGGFALLGVRDYSLLTFLRIYIRWRRTRRIITYRGILWENKNNGKKSKKGN